VIGRDLVFTPIINPNEAEMPEVERAVPVFSEQQLWEKYLMVTKEMLKFISQQDVENFLKLVEQRERLMNMLKDMEPHVFGKTEAGAAIREQIKPMDQEIMYKARTWLNKSKRNNMAVKSYDITGYAPAGNVFNKEY
jgi:hypothetical protein